jgi:hypothetical protein
MLIYQQKRLNENEKKVGYALVEILENWERAFQSGRWF